MGLLGKLLGIKQGQPYVDAGTALTIKFCRQWNLPGWKDGLPEYSPEELQAIERELSRFQSIADTKMGGKAVFHDKYVGDIRRSLAGTALADCAQLMSWAVVGSDDEEEKPDWRPAVSAYLKAWAAKLDPMIMIRLGEFLGRVGEKEAAKEAYRVVLHLPTYSKNLWGPGHEQLARDNLQLAKDALAGMGS